jgi:hypothetical protein
VAAVRRFAEVIFLRSTPARINRVLNVRIELRCGLTADQVAENIVEVGRLRLDAAREFVAVTITSAC